MQCGFLYVGLYLLLPITILDAMRSQRCSCPRSESFSTDLDRGDFKSPNFPRGYCDDLSCTYEIEPKANEAVAVNLEHFATELLHDYLEVSHLILVDGKHAAIRQEILSGSELVRTSFTSAIGGGFRFVFVTDSSDHGYAGFKISFVRFRKGSRHHSPCPFPFVEAKEAVGSIEAPQSRHASCIVRINSTESIQLNVDEVSANVNLKIFDTENFDHRRRNFAVLKEIHGFARDQWPFEVVSRSSSVSILITTSQTQSSSPSYRIRHKKVASPCACPSGPFVVDKCGGKGGNGSVSLSSPGFPLEYCDNVDCEALVEQNPSCSSGHFRIKFNVFQTEIDSDYVVMKAPDEMIRFSYRAKQIEYFSVCAENSKFTIATVTDHSVTDRGYNFLIEQADAEDCSCSGGPLVMAPSLQRKTQREEVIRGRCHFADRIWRFEAPSVDKSYRFVIKVDYDLFTDKEFIEISYGENKNRNPMLYRLTSESITDGSRGSSNFELKGSQSKREGLQAVTVWYHRESASSDSELNTDRVLNFEHEWVEDCKCGETRRSADSEEWKTLTSPDYPDDYCNDLSCTWHLVAPERHRVVVNITDVDTEFGQDFLGFFNGNDTNGPHIELISGVASFDYRIQSTDSEMTIMFETDVSIRSRGFSILYKAEPLEPTERVKQSGGGRVAVFLFILLFVAGALGVAFAVKRYFDRRRMYLGDDSLIEYTTNLRAESQISLFRE